MGWGGNSYSRVVGPMAPAIVSEARQPRVELRGARTRNNRGFTTDRVEAALPDTTERKTTDKTKLQLNYRRNRININCRQNKTIDKKKKQGKAAATTTKPHQTTTRTTAKPHQYHPGIHETKQAKPPQRDYNSAKKNQNTSMANQSNKKTKTKRKKKNPTTMGFVLQTEA